MSFCTAYLRNPDFNALRRHIGWKGKRPARKSLNFRRMKPSAVDSPPTEAVPFADLGLSDAVLRAVKTIGYESASPIRPPPSLHCWHAADLWAGATALARSKPLPAIPSYRT